MIVGEYGNVLRIGAQEDISANTNTIELDGPGLTEPKIITTANGLTVGSTDKNIDGVDYLAGEYVEYTFKDGDINTAGGWEVCLISLTSGGENKKLGPLKFSVTSC